MFIVFDSRNYLKITRKVDLPIFQVAEEEKNDWTLPDQPAANQISDIQCEAPGKSNYVYKRVYKYI